ncbi:MAG: PD-(D/E)XK nuclease family protein, partial [Thermodesulfobacteriota bacterium]
MTRSAKSLVVAPDAARRIAAAARWLEAHGPDAEVLVLAASQQAADELVRAATSASGARFGVQRMTLGRLAALLAVPALTSEGRAPASQLSLTAVAARATHLALQQGRLPHLGRVARRPGFATALARTLGELRMSGIEPDALRPLGRATRDLAELSEAAQRELDALAVADRARAFAAARAAAAV